jgi:hypothetical protein
VIASSDLAFGLSRICIALTDDCDVTTIVFHSAGEAGDWLGRGIEMEKILS